MTEIQELKPIAVSELCTEVKEMLGDGQRLVQISCTKTRGILELSYSFDKNGKFKSLRLEVPLQNAELPSISGIYFCAFLYENEIHDLFGVKFANLVLDFKGSFYRTSIPSAFNLQTDKQNTDLLTKTDELEK